jgi:heme o synthase
LIVENPTAPGGLPPGAVTVPAAGAARAPDHTEGRASAHAWLELTKPGITRMVLVTTAAGFYMASLAGAFDLVALLHTLLGTALAASGCNALNQVAERHNDARMPRTAQRPLPTGRLGYQAALVYATGLAVTGLLYLLVFVNGPTATLVALSISSYVLVYTPLKQRSWHATVVGALPGALPILAGWTAAGGAIDAGGGALFAILFLWQMPHFFALAWIYRDDYHRGGFRLLPWGDPGGRLLAVQVVAYGVALIPASLLPTWLGMTGALYLWGALLLGGAFLALGVALALRRTEQRAWRLFYGSIAYLPALLLLMVLDKVRP